MPLPGLFHADSKYLDSDNILKSQQGRRALIVLEDGSHPGCRQEHCSEGPPTNAVYEAVRIMKNGSCYLLRIAGDSGRITSESGHGYFKVKYAPSKQELEAAQ